MTQVVGTTSSRYLVHTTGWKNRIEIDFTFQLPEYLWDRIKREWTTRWWRLFKDEESEAWYATAFIGFCWDGPTCWFNYPRLRIPSLKHDLYHEFIRIGVMGDSEIINNLIDLAIEEAILESAGRMIARRSRARLIRRATNLVDQKNYEMPKPMHWIEAP